MRRLDDIIYSMDMSLSNLREIVKDREAWRAAVPGITKSRSRLSDWGHSKYMDVPFLCLAPSGILSPMELRPNAPTQGHTQAVFSAYVVSDQPLL